MEPIGQSRDYVSDEDAEREATEYLDLQALKDVQAAIDRERDPASIMDHGAAAGQQEPGLLRTRFALSRM